jgi:hypothetical protein
MEEALAWARAQGVMTGGREADSVSRAEAAVMLTRALRLPEDLPEGQVAYFSDVDEGSWFFKAAHAARRFGLFLGGGNRFGGNDALTPEHARMVLDRARGAAPIAPEQQSPGQAPMLQPDGLARMLGEAELSYEDVAKAREKVAAKPEEEKADLYRQLASKVDYRNQRDNAGKYTRKDARAVGSNHNGDVMCNVTSIAMALNQLGLGVDESSKQFEDLLDETLVEGRMGSRYELGGQSKVAAKFGAKTERISTPAFQNGASAQAWYQKNVLPKFEAGASATMSIAFGPKRNQYHIVRLEWVESGGLRVDDPYGALFKSGKHYTYDKNEVSSEEGEGAKGEDRLWSWDTVAATNRGRYVQIFTRADGK